MMTTKKCIILIISILSYAYFVKEYVVLMMLLALCLCMLNRIQKNWSLVLGIAILISVFCLLKSAVIDWKLPLGYSVFAFSAISMLVDSKKEQKEYGILDQLCFLFFIPKIMAGPIVRADVFVTQLNRIEKIRKNEIYLAAKLLLYAGFCKFIVADNLINVDNLNSIRGLELFVASLVYGIRFFIDFYSYSIMAVALALLVGINLPYNFNNPYHSVTFKDFWKRWNITLSEWLRDYVYIPLGGNQKGEVISCLNVICVFIISALWHGVSIPFMIWGIGHALLLTLERQFSLNGKIYRLLVVLICCMMWQLFRLDSLSELANFSSSLFALNRITSPSIFITLAVSIFFVWLIALPAFERIVFTNTTNKKDVYVEVALCAIMLTVLLLMPGQASFNFFYLQF